MQLLESEQNIKTMKNFENIWTFTQCLCKLITFITYFTAMHSIHVYIMKTKVPTFDELKQNVHNIELYAASLEIFWIVLSLLQKLMQIYVNYATTNAKFQLYIPVIKFTQTFPKYLVVNFCLHKKCTYLIDKTKTNLQTYT